MLLITLVVLGPTGVFEEIFVRSHLHYARFNIRTFSSFVAES